MPQTATRSARRRPRPLPATFAREMASAEAATGRVACAGGTAGGMYYDTDVNELCICNGTSWLEVSDMSTGCS